jgi:hypothetical protein
MPPTEHYEWSEKTDGKILKLSMLFFFLNVSDVGEVL